MQGTCVTSWTGDTLKKKHLPDIPSEGNKLPCS
jgi:hypothetical protein